LLHTSILVTLFTINFTLCSPFRAKRPFYPHNTFDCRPGNCYSKILQEISEKLFGIDYNYDRFL
jgi:hypothetical protein